MGYLDRRAIRVALGEEPADLVVENGNLLNVYTDEVLRGGVAVAGNRIAAAGDVGYCIGPATQRIDAGGRYLAPGLIDAHLHPEVSKITLTRLANAVVPRGTTAIVCSLDQAGAVAGPAGMRFLLDEAKATPLKIFHAAPARLPYTLPASTIGHRFGPKEYAVAREWPEAVGLWEYLAGGALDDDPLVERMADMALERRLGLHGHAPGASGRALAACAAAGMHDEHESHGAEELAAKLTNGLYGFIRRGTHVDDVRACIKLLTEQHLPAGRLGLCTDDIDCRDLVALGLVDHLVRYVISLGVDPLTAIRMGSLNTAEAYRVDHLVGSITPGRLADILLVDDLTAFTVSAVIADGRLVAEAGQMLAPAASPAYPATFLNTVYLDRPLTGDDIYLRVDPYATSADVLVIHRDPAAGPLRRRREATLRAAGGKLLPSPEQDVLYIAVVERHTGRGGRGVGLISGFGLQRGAIATSLAPNDENIVCIGANLDDMATAVNHIAATGGGQVVVESGRVVADLRLPLLGLMADVPAEEMAEAERQLDEAVRGLGSPMARPFFHLLFLSIAAIPEVAITDQGVVEHATGQIVDPVLRVYGGAA